MGNQQCICCEEAQNKTQNDLPQVKIITFTESVRKPKLWQKVSQHLATFKPFQSLLPSNPKLTKFGKDIFEGELNYKNKPQGYGTMYFHNGSVFVGQFENGMANGPGHYVFSDGSYYNGHMQANQADGISGQYVSDDVFYKGGFKANMFEGKGEQKGKTHQFKGVYRSSKKVEGTLTWVEEAYDIQEETKVLKNRTYIGSFDQNGQFNGEGKLINEYGQYNGQFLKGKKHGKGEFTYKSGIKYVGSYKQDIKQGEGTVFSKSGTIAFCGQMKNGLPNGKGYVINSFGDKVHLNWVDGLDQRLLQTKKQIPSIGVTTSMIIQ